MKTRNRLLALLLALLLLFSLLPAAALAEEGELPTDEDTELVGFDGGEGDGEGDGEEDGEEDGEGDGEGGGEEACEHDLLVTVVPATCTEPGYTLHACTLCEYSYTDGETEIDPENHDYQEIVTAPTCLAQGYTTHACSRCGDSYTDDYTDPDPNNHTPVEVEELPATEEAPGHKAGAVCSVCRAVLSGCEVIPQLEPKPEDAEADVLRITVQPADAPIVEGAAEFSVEAEAEEGETPQYQWQRLDDSVEYEGESREDAWTALEGETAGTLRLTGLVGLEALQAALPLRYRCVVTAGEASVTTKEVRLLLDEQKLDDTVISGFAELKQSEYEWEYKPTLAQLRSALPEELDVLVGGTGLFTADAEGEPLLLAVRDAGEKMLPVVWTCVQDYDDDLAVFDFVPAAEDHKLAEGLCAPGIKARVGELYEGPVGGLLPGEPENVPIVGDGGGRKRGISNAQYNAYELGLLPPLRDQGQEGACWAFASLGGIETDMIHDGVIAVDDSRLALGLSEANLSYYLSHPADSLLRNGPLGDRRSFSGDFLDHGGNAGVADFIMQNGAGIVWESEGDYSSSYIPGGKESQAAQLTGVYYINPGDTAGVKSAIRTHGGVYSSIYMSAAYYYSSTYNSYYTNVNTLNHAVMLVGWDDSFPREHFREIKGEGPAGDGAWLVRNSWGGNRNPNATDQYCSAGYFWMSYYDAGFLGGSVVAFDTEQGLYDHVYAYDSLPGSSGAYRLEANKPLSVSFTAVDDETVTAVGLEFDEDNHRGSITVRCGDSVSTTAVSTSFNGFYLFTLSEPVSAPKGETVTVTLRFDTGALLDYENCEGSEIFGEISFTPCLDSEGFTVGEGDGAIIVPHDLRLKLYAVDGLSSSETTEVTGVTLAGEGVTAVYGDQEHPARITGYTLALNSGESVQLTASVLPEGASNKAISWNSSKLAVATVDNGLVTGASPGTSVITATARNGESAACTVTVTGVAVESVTLTGFQQGEAKVRVFNDDSLSNVDTTNPNFNLANVAVTESYRVLPANASNKQVVWSSSNPEVFSVEADSGVGTYHKNGEATVTVKSKADETKSDSLTVRVQLSEYTVAYDAGGGRNAPASQTKYFCLHLPLSAQEPTRDGYAFLGWATSNETGAAVVYHPGDVYTGNADLTLYAVWQPLTYTIKFVGNGNTGGKTANLTKSAASGEIALANGFTRSYHTFTGWNTQADGLGAGFAQTADILSLIPCADEQRIITLYAQWEALSYSIVFAPNGGEGEMEPLAMRYGTGAALPANEFTREGYRFSKWNTKADGRGTSYADGATVNNLSTVNGAVVTLYACWTANRYTVAFDANGGTGSMRAQSMSYGTSAALTANAFKKVNHTFLGWSEDPEAAEPTWTNRQSVRNLTAEDGGTVRLYAVWTKNSYRIVFHPNGGAGDMSEDGGWCDYDGSYTLPLCSYERPGFTFLGWSTSAKGKVQYQDGQQITGLSNVEGKVITLYAVWAVHRYSICFDGNGNTGGNTKPMNNLSCGTAYTLTANAFTRTGYSFTGWSTEPDGSGEAYGNRAKRTNFSTEDGGIVTLYAQWSPVSYTITYKNVTVYDENPNPTTYNVETGATLSEPSRPDERPFLGWYADAKFKTQVESIAPGRTGNITLYARWDGSANTYTIAFDGNGATSGKMSAMTKRVVDTKYTLAANAFKRTGYSFTGWNTQADGLGAGYGNRAAVANLCLENGGTATLYAQWTPLSYTITYKNVTVYDENPNPTTYNIETGAALSEPSRPDMRPFLGWYADSGFRTRVESIAPGRTGNVTLYARWGGSANTYTIAFDGNGATSGKMSAMTKRVVDTKYTLAANAFKRTGYSFTGWNTQADGLGAGYGNRAAVANLCLENGGAVTLYAQWSPVSYTITYKNVTVYDENPNPTTYNVETGAALSEPSRPDERPFLGWYADSGFRTRVESIAPGRTGNVTLYARWGGSANTYTIAFDGNGATSGKMSAMTKRVVDTKYTLTANAFKRTGYSFTGWNTQADGLGAGYGNRAAVANLCLENGGTVTLYAQWTPLSYTITYKNVTGANIPEKQSYTPDESYTLPTPEKGGAVFLGWYTSADFKAGTRVFRIPEGSTGNKVYYAKWMRTQA